MSFLDALGIDAEAADFIEAQEDVAAYEAVVLQLVEARKEAGLTSVATHSSCI